LSPRSGHHENNPAIYRWEKSKEKTKVREADD